jgi:hypothetical protein
MARGGGRLDNGYYTGWRVFDYREQFWFVEERGRGFAGDEAGAGSDEK